MSEIMSEILEITIIIEIFNIHMIYVFGITEKPYVSAFQFSDCKSIEY